ncbi:hypothetical protein UT300003_33080 [Clostridium sardiniense]
MKNYNINIKKSQQLLFKSTNGIRLGIGFGYVDAHKFGIYNRHCFL